MKSKNAILLGILIIVISINFLSVSGNSRIAKNIFDLKVATAECPECTPQNDLSEDFLSCGEIECGVYCTIVNTETICRSGSTTCTPSGCTGYTADDCWEIFDEEYCY